MLTLFRRHTRNCPHTSRKERRCRCPIAVEGTLNGKMMRKSLGLRSWEAAQKRILEWEVAGAAVRSVTVADACDLFVKDCEGRHLSEATLKKYRLLSKELKSEFGDVPLKRMTVEDLDRYRDAWRMVASSSRKKLERLRTFFGFCVEREWIPKNLARALKPPRVMQKPTLPFSENEMEMILRATEIYRDGYDRCPREYARKVRAFVLMLRYSGLRISDVVGLAVERVRDGKLFLYTQKTGVPVHIPLPDHVVEALAGIGDGRYYFWSGNGQLESAMKDWQRTLRQLFAVAGVKGHAHQFRDNFAVSLLQAGVSIETVSILLGHSSIRTTEKHYAPWIESRQAALEAAVKATWGGAGIGQRATAS